MKQLLPVFIFSFFSIATFGQKIVEITLQETLTKAELSAVLFGAKNGIEAYKVLYETTDSDGTIDVASGLLVIPLLDIRDKSLPILAYQHGTVSERNNVPSNIENGERLLPYFFAGQGYYATAADYLGLGESKRVIHPYIHAATEASAGIDLVQAAKTYLASEGIPFNEQLFITGYSQGGHAAMAMHKELETNPVEGLKVTAGSHMSGIYNLSGELLKSSLTDAPYEFPSYLVWIIVAYQSVYGNIYEDLVDVFWDKAITEIKGFESGIITRGELNGLLLTKLNNEFGSSINKFLLNPSFLEDFQNNPNNALRIALRDNDVYNWIPAAPMRMMYCMADDQVAFTNSVFTDSIMNANGAIDVASKDVNPTADHGGCVVPAVLNTAGFFGEFAVRELILGTKDIDQTLQFEISPNPATNFIHLTFHGLANEFQDFNLRLINLNGQVVQQMKTNNLQNFTFPLNELANGLYLMQIQSENGFWTEKVIIRN